MTNSNDLLALHTRRASDAIDAMLDTIIIAAMLDDSDDAIIDTATLILEITDADPHDLLHNAIAFAAFDILDLDDDMLLDRINDRIALLNEPNE
jgi:hypothetical protein